MSSFERAEEQEIVDALARQAEPSHQFHPELRLVDPAEPERGWERIPAQHDLSPNVRHINRTRGGMQWLGPAIVKPPDYPPRAA